MNHAHVSMLLAALTAVACGAADEPASGPGWAGRIEERDGVPWVLNPAEDPVDPVSVSFELEQVFGADAVPEAAMIQLPIGVTVDDAGVVYVVDAGRDTRLLAFAPAGDLRWSSGSPGEGPGQLNRPRAVAWDGQEGLYVSNGGGARVDVWGTDGTHVGGRALVDVGIAQGYVAGVVGGDLVLWNLARGMGDSALIYVLDTTGEWKVRTQFVVSGGRSAAEVPAGEWGGVPDLGLHGDRVWVGSVYEYALREYDLEGRLLRVVTREHPPLISPLTYRGTGLSFGSFDAPEWLGEGHGLVIRNRVSNVDSADGARELWDEHLAQAPTIDDPFDYEAAVDVVDSTGRILGSVRLAAPVEDHIGWPVLVGPDGRLYTRAMEPYPQVRRYRVELAAAADR